ncbi:MAG: formate--tetrahydrofolate ligase [Candidatus Saccharibacteria bacterium]|nr:formate--tetrahydrofolate ligase [Candidatus Saccharibacteria bacterium]
MKTDIEIAQSAKILPIEQVAAKLNLMIDELEGYGRDKAKIVPKTQRNRNGKLILVTAISPTKAGEGKTTTSIGLADALAQLNKSVAVALREPSLGPSFGMKGGACGGGYAQVVPMADINLHFTGDLHAISAAHNLLAALIDNHIYQGNQLKINPERIIWRRVVDLNDRALREITVGLPSANGMNNGVVHQSGFDITVASEIMAILCLSRDLMDFKARVSRIVVAYNQADKPVTAGDLQAEGALTLLMKDAIKPNLVQTLEGTPALIHGGPFANIAHGCNSLIATRAALDLADYVVTEAGFGADLGAEKFFDLKCAIGGLKPDAVVLVATIRALKMHGGMELANLETENLTAVETGFSNLAQHIANIRKFGLEPIIALNYFPTDTDAEIDLLEKMVTQTGAKLATSKVFTDGGAGGLELADLVLAQLNQPINNHFTSIYTEEMSIVDKINVVAKQIYGAGRVILSQQAQQQLADLERLGYNKLRVCIAKTQYSFSDNDKILGAPTGHDFHVRELRLAAGAGFIVVIAGNIFTMPGLPKQPIACQVDIDRNGTIYGLF